VAKKGETRRRFPSQKELWTGKKRDESGRRTVEEEEERLGGTGEKGRNELESGESRIKRITSKRVALALGKEHVDVRRGDGKSRR